MAQVVEPSLGQTRVLEEPMELVTHDRPVQAVPASRSEHEIRLRFPYPRRKDFFGASGDRQAALAEFALAFPDLQITVVPPLVSFLRHVDISFEEVDDLALANTNFA